MAAIQRSVESGSRCSAARHSLRAGPRRAQRPGHPLDDGGGARAGELDGARRAPGALASVLFGIKIGGPGVRIAATRAS